MRDRIWILSTTPFLFFLLICFYHGSPRNSQDANKPELLEELVRMCDSDSLPLLVEAILILFAVEKRKIMIITILGGLLYSMLSLRVLTRKK